MAAPLPLLSCERGIHLCRPQDLAYWLNEELWRCEVAGEVQEGVNCLLVQRTRLLGRVEAWTPRLLEKLLPQFLEGLPFNVPEVKRYGSTARELLAKGDPFSAAYSAAIAAGKAVASADEVRAFHAARARQGELIGAELGLR
jgi:hypothetical protein